MNNDNFEVLANRAYYNCKDRIIKQLGLSVVFGEYEQVWQEVKQMLVRYHLNWQDAEQHYRLLSLNLAQLKSQSEFVEQVLAGLQIFYSKKSELSMSDLMNALRLHRANLAVLNIRLVLVLDGFEQLSSEFDATFFSYLKELFENPSDYRLTGVLGSKNQLFSYPTVKKLALVLRPTLSKRK